MKSLQDSQGTAEIQSSTPVSHGSQTDQQTNLATDAPVVDSGSISVSSNDSRKVSREDIELVQNLIERCLQLYMNKDEVVKTLLNRARIEPGFTTLVWQKLEEENAEFFRAYYIRLKLNKTNINANFSIVTMTNSGWSWSPEHALATFNSGLDPLQPYPAATTTLNRLPGISNLNLPNPIGHGGNPVLPPQGSNKENMTPSAAASSPAGNAATPRPKATPPKRASAARKRKSDVVGTDENLFPDDAPEISDDDPRLMPTRADTCNQVRRKIRAWTESGAMKVGEFQGAINVSSPGYSSFMNRTGTWDGEGCDTYIAAHIFFKKRELQGLPLKASNAKKPKKAGSAQKPEELLDVGGVELPGEDAGRVPIYDTCDEVRKKARAFLAKDGITQAAFVREISKTFKDDRSVSPANLRYFMGRKGILDGNTNVTYYAAYVFFEKQRIKAGKPKTKYREGMEKAHGARGVDTTYSSNGYITLRHNERAHMDKYGKTQIVTIR